jgi:hypothetical protein
MKNLPSKITDIGTIKKDFYCLLEGIVRREKHNFAGIGMLVYDSNSFDNLNSVPLRPSISLPTSLSLGKQDTLNFLVNAASIDSPIHDGFIFFNEKGLLTHISQYFGPPPVKNVEPNENYGTRYHAVLFGSYLKGVIIAGGVTSGNHYYIFEHGKLKKGNGER